MALCKNSQYIGQYLWDKVGSRNNFKNSKVRKNNSSVVTISSRDGLTQEVVGVYTTIGKNTFFIDIAHMMCLEEKGFGENIPNKIHMTCPLHVPLLVQEELAKNNPQPDSSDDEEDDEEYKKMTGKRHIPNTLAASKKPCPPKPAAAIPVPADTLANIKPALANPPPMPPPALTPAVHASKTPAAVKPKRDPRRVVKGKRQAGKAKPPPPSLATAPSPASQMPHDLQDLGSDFEEMITNAVEGIKKKFTPTPQQAADFQATVDAVASGMDIPTPQYPLNTTPAIPMTLDLPNAHYPQMPPPPPMPQYGEHMNACDFIQQAADEAGVNMFDMV